MTAFLDVQYDDVSSLRRDLNYLRADHHRLSLPKPVHLKGYPALLGQIYLIVVRGISLLARTTRVFSAYRRSIYLSMYVVRIYHLFCEL